MVDRPTTPGPLWRRAAGLGLVLGLLAGGLAADQVRFEVNDARVRDKPVVGARIVVVTSAGGEPVATAETDANGVAVLELDPAVYWVSYLRRNYVPIRDSETEVRGDGQVITTTLSMLLEAESGGPARRVRIVLNWGSDPDDARDVDGHALCACGQDGAHVYYVTKRHEYEGHTVELDVDDVDWGGPETITLSDPPPGAYTYQVHQYSQDHDNLGQSDLVVRVLFDDRLVAEIRGPQWIDRYWRPFKEIVVGPDLTPRLVHFDADELAAGKDREAPRDLLPEASNGWAWETCLVVAAALFGIGVVGAILGTRWLRARSRKKSSR